MVRERRRSNPSWAAADIDTNADGATSVHVADMDGDGDLDIVSSSFGDDTIAWYENDGAADPSWTAADIATSADGANWVYVADMDGDGDLDIVSASERDDTIAWYENDGAANPSWTAADIATSADGATSVHVADMDGDGDLDIVSSSYFDDTIAWYEETGTGTWTNTTGLSQPANATCSVSPALPTGLSIDTNTCTISGTPTAASSNTTYTVTAVISGVTYQTTVWLSSLNQQLTPSVEGADLFIDEVMTNITFQYNASASSGSGSSTCVGPACMVKDINASGNGAVPPLHTVGNDIYFRGDDGTNGMELWKTDGTTSGTMMVKDIWSGSSSGHLWNGSLIGWPYVNIGNTVYFAANDGTNGYELWKTDGTASGTVMVKDINASGSSFPSSMYALGNTLYFRADDGTNGNELWKSDGTASGTVMVKDIWSGSPSSWIYHPTSIGNTLYFSATDGTGSELWKSDGTASGTVMVKDIRSNAGSWPSYLTVIGNTLYFTANDGTNGVELWKTDGTTSGTVMVKDINSGAGSGNPISLTAIGSTLYFNAYDQTNGAELWKSDGTASGTVMVKDINSGSSSGNPTSSGPSMAVVGSTLYFTANDGTNGNELWKSDGTASGTVMVKDINASGDSSPYSHTPIGNTLYFEADDGTNGHELWKSDGTASGTEMVVNIRPGNTNELQYHFYNGIVGINNSVYFTANDGTNGYELWTLSGGSGSGGMTNVTGATCSISPSLPAGLSIDSSTCTISGTPTVETSNTTYTVTAVISNVTYQGSVWLSTSAYGTITSAVEGAALNLGEAMTPITLNYTVNANASSGSGSSSSSGTSSSTSFAYANNKIYAGGGHTCAILDGGDVKCWGMDSYGQLGDGFVQGDDGYTHLTAPPSSPIDLGTGRTAVAVGMGGNHACAVLDNGDLKCWGSDHSGQLGDGGSTNSNVYAPSSTPIDLGQGRTAVAVSTMVSTCAILDNGDLKCWGSDQSGQLGDGGTTHNSGTWTTQPSSTPVDLGQGRTAVAVSVGGSHVCAILDNGDLKCWGSDAYGQLGDGGATHNGYTMTTQPSSTPVDLGQGRTAVAVSAGNSHTCAILDNGDLKCWGWDRYGQLGDGGTSHDSNTKTTQPSSTPVDLGQGRTAVAVSTWGDFTCAILDNGDLKCWGRDSWGQLGDGGADTDIYAPSSTPVDLGVGRTAVAVSAGAQHTCAILDNGDAKCWGYGVYGRLGNGGTTDQSSPVSVSGSNTWDTTTTVVTWETHPALPAGMSISGGTISGTPSVYAKNQTYTIYANQSGYSTTHELYFSVDTDNAHTVVENQTIDPIGFHPPFNNGTTCWSVSPGLPGNLSIDSSTGEITGSVNGTLTNTTYTVTANHGCTGSGTGGGSGNGTVWTPWTPPSGIHIQVPVYGRLFHACART